MNKLEFESRTLINEKDYLSLFDKYSKLYPNHQKTNQTNIYFDTKELVLAKEQGVLRLRTYEDHRPSKLTLKISRKDIEADEEIFQKLSIQEELNLLSKCSIPNGIVKESLTKMNIKENELRIVGELKTNRFEVFEKEYTIVLDKNEYSSIVDYNLEIESSSRELSNKVMMTILKESKIKLQLDVTTKSQRAREAYLKKSKSR